MLRAFRLKNDDAHMTSFMLLGLLRVAASTAIWHKIGLRGHNVGCGGKAGVIRT